MRQAGKPAPPMTETVRPPTVFDTDQQHVGGVYAKAVLAAAVKLGLARQILEEMDSFVIDVLDRLPMIEAMLASPRVPLEAKYRLFGQGPGRAGCRRFCSMPSR